MRVPLRLRVWVGIAYATALDRSAAIARALIPRQSAVGRRLLRLKRWLQPRPVLKQTCLLRALAQRRSDVRFVQIGANDGVLEDPLREFILRHHWRGVLVEPLRHVHERLRRNYAGCDGLIFENVAVSPREGPQDFYFIPEDAPAAIAGLPEWYTGLGSLSKDVILKHAAEYPAIGRRLAIERVECVTFDSLCARNGVERVDVISIDAEGHDFEILKLINFAQLRPVVLLYEHHHMSSAQKAESRERLAALGYDFLEEVLNTVCFNTGALRPGEDDLPALWRELKAVGWIPW